MNKSILQATALLLIVSTNAMSRMISDPREAPEPYKVIVTNDRGEFITHKEVTDLAKSKAGRRAAIFTKYHVFDMPDNLKNYLQINKNVIEIKNQLPDNIAQRLVLTLDEYVKGTTCAGNLIWLGEYIEKATIAEPYAVTVRIGNKDYEIKQAKKENKDIIEQIKAAQPIQQQEETKDAVIIEGKMTLKALQQALSRVTIDTIVDNFKFVINNEEIETQNLDEGQQQIVEAHIKANAAAIADGIFNGTIDKTITIAAPAGQEEPKKKDENEEKQPNENEQQEKKA